MLLIVDASSLIGDVLRVRGRARLSDPRLFLCIAAHTIPEVLNKLPRRVEAQINKIIRDSGIPDDEREEFAEAALRETAEKIGMAFSKMSVVPASVYSRFENEARARCAQDPDDWAPVACALALEAPVWTEDKDFLGFGVPTWTTRTLQTWLNRQPPPPPSTPS